MPVIPCLFTLDGAKAVFADTEGFFRDPHAHNATGEIFGAFVTRSGFSRHELSIIREAYASGEKTAKNKVLFLFINALANLVSNFNSNNLKANLTLIHELDSAFGGYLILIVENLFKGFRPVKEKATAKQLMRIRFWEHCPTQESAAHFSEAWERELLYSEYDRLLMRLSELSQTYKRCQKGAEPASTALEVLQNGVEGEFQELPPVTQPRFASAMEEVLLQLETRDFMESFLVGSLSNSGTDTYPAWLLGIIITLQNKLLTFSEQEHPYSFDEWLAFKEADDSDELTSCEGEFRELDDPEEECSWDLKRDDVYSYFNELRTVEDLENATKDHSLKKVRPPKGKACTQDRVKYLARQKEFAVQQRNDAVRLWLHLHTVAPYFQAHLIVDEKKRSFSNHGLIEFAAENAPRQLLNYLQRAKYLTAERERLILDALHKARPTGEASSVWIQIGHHLDMDNDTILRPKADDASSTTASSRASLSPAPT